MNQKGQIYEDIATSYFLKEGYRIISRNFSYKYGEIDIIAIKNNVLHLIEVKGGKDILGDPAFRVNSNKLKKIMRVGNYFIAKNHHIKFEEVQIDVISVTDNGKINYYPAQRI